MTHVSRIPGRLDADEFIGTDQCKFGDAWRYEFVDGEIMSHSATSRRRTAG